MNPVKHLLKLAKVYLNYIFRRNHCSYAPQRLWIELSSRCNLECRLCVNKDIPSNLKGDMDLNLYKKIIDEVQGHVYDINLFHRGEPLLHPDIIEIIEYANKKGIKTRIHTNSTLLSQDLSKKIILAGLDLISLSFDGYTKKTYEKNRVNANYTKSLKNIINFLKLKKELNSKKPFTILQVMEFDEELRSQDFEEQKKQFLDNFYGLPLDKLVIRKPHNWGGGLQGHDGALSEKLLQCTFPWYAMVILFDGSVCLCPQDFFGIMRIGNALQTSLKDLWLSNEAAILRNKCVEKRFDKTDPCTACDRICRRNIFGIPVEYLSKFLKEMV